MTQPTTPPLDLAHLLPAIDAELVLLLNSLSPEEWQAQTIARLWKVKDVVAHLLDGNIRVLSMLRDGYVGETPDIRSHQDLLDFLNGLNADWVKAMQRVSPRVLMLLHEVTGPLYCRYYQSLNPFDKAGFPVAWAGEAESKNWMHIAREYTEKWLHQQQIREAVNRPGLMTRQYFYPFIDTFMFALPHTYRSMTADEGTVISLTVSSAIGGTWFLRRAGSRWNLQKESSTSPAAAVFIDPDTAWKLFSKSLRPEQVLENVRLEGNETLGRTALNMVSVMA